MTYKRKSEENFMRFVDDKNPSQELMDGAEKDVLINYFEMVYMEYKACKQYEEAKASLDEWLQNLKESVKELKESTCITNESLSSFERYYDFFSVLLDSSKGLIKNKKKQAALAMDRVTFMQTNILPVEVFNESEAYAENPIGMAIRHADEELVKEALKNHGFYENNPTKGEEEELITNIFSLSVELRDAVNRALVTCFRQNINDGIEPDILPDGSYAINGEVIYESKTSLDYDMSFLDEIGLTPENYDEWIQKHAPEGYITHKEFKASLDDVLNNNDIDLAAKALVPKKKGLFGKLFRR